MYKIQAERNGGQMNKSMYSLILSDEVVEAVDRMAKLSGLTRSGLVNKVLAEYVSYVTPEQRMRNTIEQIEKDIKSRAREEFKLMFAPNDSAITAMSVLKYKYNPSIKYNVLLSRDDCESCGELRVTLRTQNASLIEDFGNFCRAWCSIEEAVLADVPAYEVIDGAYRRQLKVSKPCSTEKLAKGISAYIQVMNSCLRLFISERENVSEAYDSIAKQYVISYKKGLINV